MRLHSIIRYYDPRLDLANIPNPPIASVQDDSRLVRDGDLFIARPGTTNDGARFAQDAQSRGAVAIISQEALPDLTIPQIIVQNAAIAGSKMANASLGNPSQLMKVLGITGTNGKTTTVYLLRHILNALNTRCGMMGTVEIDDGSRTFESSLTTPGPIQIAEYLANMRQNHCHAVAMEVSSHALDQHRTAGVQFAGAGFTNLTGDHLDYHGDMVRYAQAKAKLFSSLTSDTPACINIDSSAHSIMIKNTDARIVTFSLRQQADYRASDININAQGTQFLLTGLDGQTLVNTKLIGKHNIENILCATALACEVFNFTVHQVAGALKTATGAPGRLQIVQAGQPFAVLVDYAHTDDALKNVLQALRPLTKGKLRVLFGCGGDRDATKRPRMASIAQSMADVVYITSDNPRTEAPDRIISDIVSGLTVPNSKNVIIEPDRRTAIEQALTDARPGDIVLLAGKGHENYQIIGTTKHHFDDIEEATRMLEDAYQR